MKKLFLLLLIGIIMIPTAVKADRTPISISGYSKQATLGSEIIFQLKGYTKFDGKLEYNSEELEYLSTNIVNAVLDDVLSGQKIEVLSNEPGKLVFKYYNPSESTEYVNILISFRVKSVPEDNKTKITYYPDDSSVLYNGTSKELEYSLIPTSGTYTVVDSKECPQCEKAVEKDTNKCVTEEKKEDKTFLYFFGGMSSILLVTNAITLIRFKKYKRN